MHIPLICVIYDGINNPVFVSQVLAPLQKRGAQGLAQEIVIISFEANPPSQEALKKIIPQGAPLRLIVLKKYPFLGGWSLYPAVRQLRTFLQQIPAYHLLARGPLAGYLCLQALSQTACRSFDMQARGLLAAEYEYTHNLHGSTKLTTNGKSLKYWLKKIRLCLYNAFERTIYHESILQKYYPQTHIEAVSKALKEHLITRYYLQAQRITVAEYDIPTAITPAQKASWRTEIRRELHIPLSAHVFCYNGSLKPWQCPKETVALFLEELRRNPHTYLLVLTQDKQEFEELAKKNALPANCYTILTVPHKEIYRYLAACDVGLLLREPHLMNWISRPTKALEYKAAGIAIMHNNTVACLTENQFEI